MNSLGRYGFRVRSYECGAGGAVTLASICNYLQESASMHAESLGFSKVDFAADGENITWVLTRMKIKMMRYPKWGDEVLITTFPRGGRKITAFRDFEVSVNGELVGIATSEWMIIDLATRKVVAVPQRVYDLANDERTPVFGESGFARLRWECRDTGGAIRMLAKKGDIDMNGHVNNVHYVEWLLEALPRDAGQVEEMEIAFKSETLAGETVCAEAVEIEPKVYAARVASTEGKDHAVAMFQESGAWP